MSKQKVTLRIEEGELELLKEKYKTDNQSEAIRLAIMESLAIEPQALILISRRLISIIYGMLKNKTEYVMPKVQDNWE